MKHSTRFAFIILAAGTLFSCTEQFLEKGDLTSKISSDAVLSQAVPSASKTTQISQDAYIVVYKEGTSDKEVENEVGEMENSEKINTEHVYNKVFKGYAAILSPSALAKVKQNSKVAYVEKDQIMSINLTTMPNPVWGLDRIDQVSLPLSTSFSYNSNGTGVDAYIIDTGIFLSHADFGGRAVGGFSSIGASTNWVDQNGHGTHVSGIVGGSTYGVAKNVKLIAVRVLDATGSGTTSGVIAGINWAINHHTTNPAVANMSLGGSASSALDLAVSNAVKDGIVMCVAAGNNAADASRYSPARVSTAITVGATGAYPTLGLNYDVFASYSNYGTLVDVLAPGSSILSDYVTNSTATTAILSGTSMATPHVAGVVASYLANNKTALPSQVETYIKSSSTKNKITGIRGTTANNLLFTNN